MTSVVDCDHDALEIGIALEIGMALEVAYRPISDELTIPVLRPSPS